ncbi:MAG: hypothetical protein A2Y33_10020 [Spirochaetes bacterium GWF1_51_8]|nr:MAG: hypothetical protein A2Y33_10020 [Spirochaetes bacterium GWF1_51_8]
MKKITGLYCILMLFISVIVGSCGNSAKGGGVEGGITKPDGLPTKDYYKDKDDGKPVVQTGEIGKKEDKEKTKLEEDEKNIVTDISIDDIKNGKITTVVPGDGGGEKPKSEPKKDPEKTFDKENVPMAGEHDDNEEYQYYLDFLTKEIKTYKKEYPQMKGVDKLQEILPFRNVIAVTDKNGKPVFGAEVKIAGKSITTYADGEILYYFSPSELGKSQKIKIGYQGKTYDFDYTPEEFGRPVFVLDTARIEIAKIPVDIVFLMDTTGSMGDEIEQLCNTIFSINERILKISKGSIQARFGMVLYRDDTDDYLTKEFELTDKFDSFYEFLMDVEANGGGDYPEDMVSGIEKVLNMKWKKDAVKLVFLVTDAPAKVDSLVKMANLGEQAAAKQIKFFTIGASELNITGEVHLRILSQVSKGKFIFLTYGEKGESEGGGKPEDPGMVSHHTGANYQSRSLDDIIVDNVKSEIYNLADQGLVAQLKKEYDYKNFTDEIYRRIDNALQQIMKQTAGVASEKKSVMILPPDIEEEDLKPLSSHIVTVTEDIIIKAKYMTVVERQKMEAILGEIKLKLAEVVEGSDEIKQLTGADMILASKIYYIGGTRVYYAKLIDASNGEVIASALVKL